MAGPVGVSASWVNAPFDLGAGIKGREPIMQDVYVRWVFGVIYVLLGFLGLVMASGAHDQPFFIAGMLFFLFGVFNVFRMIARSLP